MDIIILLLALILLFNDKIAWALFALILLTTNYLGAGTNLSEFLYIHNVSDAGLILYIFLFIYILAKNNFTFKKPKIAKYIKLFYAFLLLSIFVDIAVNHIDLLSIIKTSRHWIFLSCVWIFYYISEKDVKKLIRYILYALVIISAIMLTEFIFNIQILSREVKTEYLYGILIRRTSIPSLFLVLYLLLLLSGYFRLSNRLKYLFIGLFSAVLITSMIRSWFGALVIGIILIFSLHQKYKVKYIVTGIAIVIGLIIVVYNSPVISTRFAQGIEEIKDFKLSESVQGNLSFRLLQTGERLNYIADNVQYSIFGLGNVTEQNFPHIFYIGLKDVSGYTIQLDTADIAWSLLFIRLGFIGVFIYLVFYFNILIKFYRLRHQDQLALTMFVYLFIMLFIISFASSDIANGQFWLFPVLIYYVIVKLKIGNLSFRQKQILKTKSPFRKLFYK